jgi:hypothetical protein
MPGIPNGSQLIVAPAPAAIIGSQSVRAAEEVARRSIASAISVSCGVTDMLVVTEEPSGMRARTASRAVQVVDDLDAEPVLFESEYGLRERPFIGQCGEAV